ncbi:MAG: hypothetical protein ACOCU4_06550 [Alkalispirochaeta sp.]
MEGYMFTRETVARMIQEAIDSESHLQEEYHIGRVDALRFALSLVKELEESKEATR